MTSTEPPAPLTITRHGDVAVITLDDGKANALSHRTIELFHEALDASQDATALVVVGRPGKFSAGFDLSVVEQGPEAAAEIMARGAEISLRLLEWPVPVVLGVTGHALAMGAVLLGCADVRIGAELDVKVGLNEVAIGLPMPRFAGEIMRARLDPRRFHEAVTLARIYTPAEAVEIGYLDEVVDADKVVDTAIERAQTLVDYLDPTAFAITRKTMQGPLTASLRDLS